ncbi:MAG: DUF1826 domain-containing protein [Bacteroidota bacterium]
MTKEVATSAKINYVDNFQALVETKFHGEFNALCWQRNLLGDFSEIVAKVAFEGNMTELSSDQLCALELSAQGNLAREVLLNDLTLLKNYGAAPVLNLIKYYERDDELDFFSTDVYSFHVDRSPIPTSTFLCTYFGAASELLPNDQVDQKILIPEIRTKLKKLFQGDEEDFDIFLADNFFDLHYQAKPGVQPVNLGVGNLWKLAVDHPHQASLPCVHRAPMEKDGKTRLMLIC